mmetsp:Transcript_51396/g.166648  ORF Transcript_51396/g.166648 Transcript_51396/m.166648 type:complete len:88 (+) Transcript_51396:500-763(+)
MWQDFETWIFSSLHVHFVPWGWARYFRAANDKFQFVADNSAHLASLCVMLWCCLQTSHCRRTAVRQDRSLPTWMLAPMQCAQDAFVL